MPDAGLPHGELVANEQSEAATTLAQLSGRVAELERLVRALQEHSSSAGQDNSSAPLPAVAVPPLPRAVAPPFTPSPTQGSASRRFKRLATARSNASLEERLGSQIFNLVGIVAIIAGTAWALKLAIEHGLLGPVARVVLGLVVGVATVLWSETFRRKGFRAFSYTLKAVGAGVLYLVLWAALQMYHLLPAGAALAAMILVTAWNAWMAWAQDAELLAAYALAGALATPMLLSTGGDHETFLFTYLGAIDLAAVLLVRTKPWRRLLLPTLAASVAYFIAWYAEFFHPGRAAAWDGQSAETILFALAWGALFALVSTRFWNSASASRDRVLADVLLPLGNAAFVSLAIYSVLQDSGLHDLLAWSMVTLAAVYLGLTRIQRTAVASSIHLGAAVVFITVAIALKTSGQTLTTALFAEALALNWAATRVQTTENAARGTLLGLSTAAFSLGMFSLCVHWWWFGAAGDQFFNANLASALFAVAALGGTVFLAEGNAAARIATASLAAIDAVGLLLASRALFADQSGQAFANAAFASALVGLLVLAGSCWTAFRKIPGDRILKRLGAGTSILFNLVAVVATVREIDRLFAPAAAQDAGLERSLAISGFLMAYGALLLAAGFWRRSAAIRWQALVLLMFTILKVFLYDTSGLSQGYRVVSFLALGGLLLGISFAYQKDWLGLKQNPSANPGEPQ